MLGTFNSRDVQFGCTCWQWHMNWNLVRLTRHSQLSTLVQVDQLKVECYNSSWQEKITQSVLSLWANNNTTNLWQTFGIHAWLQQIIGNSSVHSRQYRSPSQPTYMQSSKLHILTVLVARTLEQALANFNIQNLVHRSSLTHHISLQCSQHATWKLPFTMKVTVVISKIYNCNHNWNSQEGLHWNQA